MPKCKEIMTSEPQCCEPSMTVHKIAQTMKSDDIGAVPIVESMDTFKLVGIVTDRDLALKVVADSADATRVQAKDVMSSDPVACNGEDEVERAIQLMEEHQVRRIPVVDEEHRLIGIISQGDIANRLHNDQKTAEMVEQISRPGATR